MAALGVGGRRDGGGYRQAMSVPLLLMVLLMLLMVLLDMLLGMLL